LELRHHDCLTAFRSKLGELQSRVRASDEKSATELVEELERNDLVEIAKLARPSPTTAIWKAIGSNVPLPIPVNPLSIGLGLADILDAYNRRSRFGWLYFLLDFAA
jgi:hypothetical protein